MRRLIVTAVLFLGVINPFFAGNPVSAQTVTCENFNTWVWAQTVMDSDPALYSQALDPDGNGRLQGRQAVAGAKANPAISE